LGTSKRVKTLKYQLKLTGLDSASGTIPVRALREVCDLLLEAAERGLRLAVEGYSVKPGRLPAWLTKSLDLAVTGVKKGSTILSIEAPMLGETAREHIQQRDFWYIVPKPEDSALSLLSKSVHDTTSEILDSNAFDAGMLESLLRFKPFLKSTAEKVELRCVSRRREHFELGEAELDKIQRLKAKTPEPRAVVISGQFDVIEHNKKRFHLVLSNGERVLGTIDPAFLGIEQMRQFWGKKVTIKGTAHFRPSREPRLIEAEVIKPMEEGEEVFDALPREQSEAEFFKTVREKFEPQKGWLKDVWGKWPGDEPIEDLLTALAKN
jgi:hypothetical protein